MLKLLKKRSRLLKLHWTTKTLLNSIKQIVHKHAVTEDAARKMLSANYPDHLESESFLISKEKTNGIKDSLNGISKFVEACKVLEHHEIPELCHADLLSKLGYDVVWNDLDPNNAKIIQK